MPLITLNSPLVPHSLRGCVGCDEFRIPRYWLTFWIDTLRANLAPATNRGASTAAGRLYETAESLGIQLDASLAKVDLISLRTAMGAHLQRLNNRARQQGIAATVEALQAAGPICDVGCREVGPAFMRVGQGVGEKVVGHNAHWNVPVGREAYL